MPSVRVAAISDTARLQEGASVVSFTVDARIENAGADSLYVHACLVTAQRLVDGIWVVAWQENCIDGPDTWTVVPPGTALGKES